MTNKEKHWQTTLPRYSRRTLSCTVAEVSKGKGLAASTFVTFSKWMGFVLTNVYIFQKETDVKS